MDVPVLAVLATIYTHTYYVSTAFPIMYWYYAVCDVARRLGLGCVPDTVSLVGTQHGLMHLVR